MTEPMTRVRNDGTIEGHYVETCYHECDGFYIDHKNEFVGVVFDNGGVNGETRILFSTLIDAGFVIPPEREK